MNTRSPTCTRTALPVQDNAPDEAPGGSGSMVLPANPGKQQASGGAEHKTAASPVAYYNEIDPFCCAWLQNLMDAGLIMRGVIDSRSIADVRADDLVGFTRVHFFAGIAGWDYALQLAGWPDDQPVWTGSCPCQRNSSAARGRNVARDWWPEFRNLIVRAAPATVFGEQVAARSRWIDVACDDLEAVGYEVWADVLPAVCVGKDHIRERIFFVCNADRNGQSSGAINAKAPWVQGHQGHSGSLVRANGLPLRMALMRAFGNAIVPQVAATFIEAFMECRP